VRGRRANAIENQRRTTEGVVERTTNILSKTPGITQLDGHAQAVEEKVIELASISLGRGSDAPGVDEPLYETEAGFDSFSLLEFILRLEDEFGIAIPDEDLDPDIFRSISTIVAYVLRRIGERASSP
jgi:acyl carrier protein